MEELANLTCIPCRKGEPTLSDQEIQSYLPQVPDWTVNEKKQVKRLQREFKFKNFSDALDFTVKVGRLADQQDHHPEIKLEWGKVRVRWWTHAIGGLHRNDFIMAAKVDELYSG
jgi:4a-hydroxytetrahydrobiopterin dehydratase